MKKTLGIATGIRRRLPRQAAAQEGQALVLVLILLTFGTLVISAFLVFASTMASVNGADAEDLLAQYAMDTGITDVFTDLVQGEDALDPGYVVPTPTINDYAVTIAVATPTPGTEPAASYYYIDPGVGYGLKSLASQTHYYFRTDNVKAGTEIRVNWGFTPNNQRWKIRLFEGTGPPGAPAPVTIAEDDFESDSWDGGSGWLYDWHHSGEAKIRSDGDPHQESYHLRMRKGNGYVDRALDLSGQSDIRVQFWAKADSFESGETATFSVSPNDVDWTVLRVWQDGEDDNVYRFEDIDLSSFSMTAEFWIAFSSNMSGNGDYFWVDEVEVVSQAMPSPIAENSSTKGPGALLVDGSLITGGAYTIDFINDSGTELVSAAFSSTGDADNTWVYAQAYKDYIVSSTAGDGTMAAYIRQAPGPTEPTTGQSILIQSWSEP